jgi:molybdopterin synthase catalytic subunit
MACSWQRFDRDRGSLVTEVSVRVRVRLFAMQRELAGTREVALELPDGATIEDAWLALVERFPVLAPGRPAVRFARNSEYAAAETRLEDGDEIAMIPPVSGGAPDDGSAPDDGRAPGPTSRDDASDAAGRVHILEMRDAPLGADILQELTARLATLDDGAVVGFLGVTRRSPGTPAPGQEGEAARHAGRAVDALEYEALPEMALRVMNEIANEIEARFGVTRLAIVHRTGEVPLGEASVAIVTCSPHRDAAFQAARYAIDETKARAPIWKAEHFADGHVWIGEPARDSAPGTEP